MKPDQTTTTEQIDEAIAEGKSAVVLDDGRVNVYERLWITQNTGYVSGSNGRETDDGKQVVEKFPPQQVARIIEVLD